MDSQNNIIAKYIYGPSIDEPLAMIKQGNVYYYSKDGLGSVVNLTDNTGTIVESYTYDEYGNVSAPSQIGNRYLYTGREYDPEINLYYYRARYYDPSIGRFLQTDPIGYYGGINLYTYVGNNPVNKTDPYGLDTAGCDGIPDFLETPCILECCAKHDECYDRYNCSSSSWLNNGGPNAAECDKCNSEVVRCFIRCGFKKKDDPNKPNYYCARQHRYVNIPGDFPDYETAKRACEYSHSCDSAN